MRDIKIETLIEAAKYAAFKSTENMTHGTFVKLEINEYGILIRVSCPKKNAENVQHLTWFDLGETQSALAAIKYMIDKATNPDHKDV